MVHAGGVGKSADLAGQSLYGICRFLRCPEGCHWPEIWSINDILWRQPPKMRRRLLQDDPKLGVGRWLVPSLRRSVLASLLCGNGCFPRAYEPELLFIMTSKYCSAKKDGPTCWRFHCTYKIMIPRSGHHCEFDFSDADWIFTCYMLDAMLIHDRYKHLVRTHR